MSTDNSYTTKKPKKVVQQLGVRRLGPPADAMSEQRWEDVRPLPTISQATPNIFTSQPQQDNSVELPNINVQGTNRMNIGSVVPQIGAPNGNVPKINEPSPWGMYTPAEGVPVTPQNVEPNEKLANVPTQNPWEVMGKPYNTPWQQVPSEPTLNTGAYTPVEGVSVAPQIQPNPNVPNIPTGLDAKGVSVVPQIPQPTGNEKAPYVDAFNQMQEAKKKALPTAKDGGRGVANWIKNNFGGDGTKQGDRRAIQNIMALGNMLRHAANLRGVSRGATPQQIADQYSINKARWDKEDALEQAKLEKQREYDRKVAKDKADADYKTKQLGYKERDANRADAKLQLEIGKNARDAEAHGWKKEDRPLEQRTKTAQANKAETEAKKAAIELEYLPKEKQAKLKQIAAQINASNASAAHSRALTEKTKKESAKLNKGQGEYVLSGKQGKFSRTKAASREEKTNIVYRAYKLGLVSKADYDAIHTKTSWTESGENYKADDLIAKLLDHAGDEEYIRDIFTSNGYDYTPYTPASALEVKPKFGK